MKRLLILVLFCTTPAVGQVLEFQGGSSTLVDAAGGSVVAYFPNQTVTIGGGTMNGQPVFGASVETLYHGWHLIAGDSPFGAVVPGAGIYAPIRGLTVKHGNLTLFVGGTGEFFSPSFFQATRPNHFGAGLFYRYGHFTTLAVDDGSLHTLIEGADWKAKRFSVEGSGGLLENRWFLDGDATVHPFKWAAFNGSHQTYTGSNRLSVNSASGSVGFGPVNGNAGFFQSKGTTGESFGISFHASAVTVQANRFVSRYGDSNQAAVSEQVTPRFHVTEFVSYSSGHWSVTGGFGYLSNHFTVDVSQAVYFMPEYVGREPFQRTLSVNLTVPLPHGTMFHGQTNVDPTGRLRFTTAVTTYEQGPLAGDEGPHVSTGGKVIVTGQVVDDRGNPVPDVEVTVGNQTAFTTADGSFSLHFSRRATRSVKVNLADSLAPGQWHLVSCPTDTSQNSALRIVVAAGSGH